MMLAYWQLLLVAPLACDLLRPGKNPFRASAWLSPDSQAALSGTSQASTGPFRFSLKLFFAADLTL